MRVDLPQTGYLGELEYNKVTASVWRPVNDSWSRVLSGNRLARGSAPPVYGMQLWFSLRGMGAGVTQPPSRKLKRKQALVCGFSGATNRAGVCVSRTLRECGRRCGQSAEGWEGLGQKGGWTRRVDVKGWSQEVERVFFFFVSLWPVHTGVCVVVRCVVCVRTVRAGQWQQQEV